MLTASWRTGTNNKPTEGETWARCGGNDAWWCLEIKIYSVCVYKSIRIPWSLAVILIYKSSLIISSCIAQITCGHGGGLCDWMILWHSQSLEFESLHTFLWVISHLPVSCWCCCVENILLNPGNILFIQRGLHLAGNILKTWVLFAMEEWTSINITCCFIVLTDCIQCWFKSWIFFCGNTQKWVAVHVNDT